MKKTIPPSLSLSLSLSLFFTRCFDLVNNSLLLDLESTLKKIYTGNLKTNYSEDFFKENIMEFHKIHIYIIINNKRERNKSHLKFRTNGCYFISPYIVLINIAFLMDIFDLWSVHAMQSILRQLELSYDLFGDAGCY